jgi:hypothetical protein
MSLKEDDVVTASTYILIKKAAWFERMAVHFCANGVEHHSLLTFVIVRPVEVMIMH